PLASADRLAYERHLAATRARLAAPAFAAAWAGGRALARERAIAEALALAADIAAPNRSTATRLAHPLSAREAEVAALIARRLTDRQIAEELVITPGTVGQHVVHILAKLG